MNRDRNELLRGILDAFDLIDELQFDNDLMRTRIAAMEKGTPEEVRRINKLDEMVLAHGRKELMKDALEYWHDVRYHVDEDTDEAVIEDFGEWSKRVVKKSSIPSWCSLDEFHQYFEAELRAVYEKEREKAVAEAHERK